MFGFRRLVDLHVAPLKLRVPLGYQILWVLLLPLRHPEAPLELVTVESEVGLSAWQELQVP